MWFLEKKKLSDYSISMSLHEIKKRARIVVIDDDQNSFPVDILKKEGYTIDAWEKVESLKTLEEGEYDIIILDIGGVAEHLSAEDGLGILEHLKKYNPTQVIVAFSGQSFDLSKNRFFKMADDSLWKPTDAVKCKEVIDALLQSKFTVQHYWDGFRRMLQNAGIEANRLNALEQKLLKSIRAQDSKGAVKIIEDLCSGLDSAKTIISLGRKILMLCGIPT